MPNHELNTDPLHAQVDKELEQQRARMRWRRGDATARLDLWAEDGIPAEFPLWRYP